MEYPSLMSVSDIMEYLSIDEATAKNVCKSLEVVGTFAPKQGRTVNLYSRNCVTREWNRRIA